jgi:hypothetical protein
MIHHKRIKDENVFVLGIFRFTHDVGTCLGRLKGSDVDAGQLQLVLSTKLESSANTTAKTSTCSTHHRHISHPHSLWQAEWQLDAGQLHLVLLSQG